MPEKTKPEKNQKDSLPETENSAPVNADNGADENWSRDQKEKSYYYDDAHGYEIYNPDEDDEAEITE